MIPRTLAHFTLSLFFVAGGGLAAEAPIAVSPGSSEGSKIEDRCPTFSWSEVEKASRYDLVVYRIGPEGETANRLLERQLPGAAQSWTPSLELCLKRGERYAWSVRAAAGGRVSRWSPPSLFEVATGPSMAEFEEAMKVVRRYLEARTSEDGVGWLRETSPEPPVAEPEALPVGGSTSAATALAATAGDPELQVNGSPVVTVATLGGALCSATETRFLDQGDGTVLDCNTGLTWLKDASCFGVSRTWFQAQNDAAFLASGDCGLTDGSVAGQWRQPTIDELCSRGAQAGTCPAENAVDSLVDSSFLSPALGNASGDGPWAPDDAFVGVDDDLYWSSVGAGGGTAWVADLYNGDITTHTKSDTASVWPVRSSP